MPNSPNFGRAYGKDETPADRAGVPRDNPWYDYVNREAAKGLQALHWALGQYHGGGKAPPRPKVAANTAKSVGGGRNLLSKARDFIWDIPKNIASIPGRLDMQPHNRPPYETGTRWPWEAWYEGLDAAQTDSTWEARTNRAQADSTNPGNVQRDQYYRPRRGGLRSR